MRSILPVALALALMMAVACDNSGSGTTPTPTPVPLTPETFNGTVMPRGSDAHSFTIAQAGEVDVTLTAAGPPSTIFMGLGVGSPSGSTCARFTNATTQVQASTAPQIVGTANPGTYCVDVFDIGNQTADVTYTVIVAHP